VSVFWVALEIDPTVEFSALRGLNFIGGARLSAEFVSLMVGLALYTSVFIGEIIRGGIDSVPKGQWEAGRALALDERQTLFRIIMPQAVRVIIPPLTSQYLSTVKNSTLAIAVGFPELSLVMNTVINQTGQAIESVLILLAAFLTISLSVSLFMNWYNRRMALVTR
jgi:general L-amino acid transport system permease protein